MYTFAGLAFYRGDGDFRYGDAHPLAIILPLLSEALLDCSHPTWTNSASDQPGRLIDEPNEMRPGLLSRLVIGSIDDWLIFAPVLKIPIDDSVFKGGVKRCSGTGRSCINCKARHDPQCHP